MKGRDVINAHRKPLADCSMEELWQGELDLELKQLDSLTEQMAEVEKRLEEIAKNDDRIRRVQTIPGVGRKTAEVIVTALDDVDRFDNARQVSASLRGWLARVAFVALTRVIEVVCRCLVGDGYGSLRRRLGERRRGVELALFPACPVQG